VKLNLARSLAAFGMALGLLACGGGSGGGGALPSLNSPNPSPAPTAQHALRFFGTATGNADRVKVPLSATTAANVGATDFTLEFWIKGNPADNTAAGCSTVHAAWGNGNVMIDRSVAGAGDIGDLGEFGVALFAGRVAFGVSRGSGGATLCGTRSVLDGTWHHIALTRQLMTGRMQIFVDGVLDAELASNVNTSGNLSYNLNRTAAAPTDAMLAFGGDKTGVSAAFHGQLDEVRLSNVLRYAGSFPRPIAPFVPDANTMALYHFDEGSGTIAADAAPGGSSPGVLRVGGASNGPQWVSDTPF
jgi:hypothetical protein